MASMKLSLVLVLLLACTLSLQGVIADIICENLPINVCAFSVSSIGKRCVLENLIKNKGEVEYQCKTSDVVVGSSMAEYIETDNCVKACGVNRKSIGISSDSLLEPTFSSKLCSPACYHNCPNIVELYFNLAAGEGAYLPDLCEKQRVSQRRDMIQLQSDGAATTLDAESAAAPDVEWTSPRHEWTSPRRNMIELQSESAASPDAVADAPTQWKNYRRAMVELLSTVDDALTMDTPAPSPSYF
nr:uncharacterized protein LOC109174892 isoform X1 [Ipomoea batatas]